jgi:AcrR family transcriptional regulator
MSIATARKKAPLAASRRGRDRRGEILKAARAVFLERGFLGASTDEILARSGGSKETLYAHFGSKLGLFREVVQGELEIIFTSFAGHADEAPLERLRLAGRGFIRQAMQSDAIAILRILIAEGVRVPELTAQLRDQAYGTIVRHFAELIANVQAAGACTSDDPETLAEIYLDLLQGGTVFRQLLEPDFRLSARELDAHADTCLERLARLASPEHPVP